MRYLPPCLLVLTSLSLVAADTSPPAQPKVSPSQLTSSSVVGGKTLDQWIQDLSSRDTGVRENAVATLMLYGQSARSAVPSIIKAAGDEDISLRVNAVIALGVIGMDDKDLTAGVGILRRRLSDSQGIIRFQAATALGRLGIDARPAIPDLVYAAKDKFAWEIRRAAVKSLAATAEDREKGPDPRAVDALARALSDAVYLVRLEAVLGFIIIGPSATPNEHAAVDRALTMTIQKDPSKVVQIWAHVAIMRMDKPSPPHLDAISKFLKSPDAGHRTNAARALGTVGKEAKSQVAELLQACATEQDDVSLFWEISALGQIGAEAQRAVPEIKSKLQHKDPAIREIANWALARIEGRVK